MSSRRPNRSVHLTTTTIVGVASLMVAIATLFVGIAIHEEDARSADDNADRLFGVLESFKAQSGAHPAPDPIVIYSNAGSQASAEASAVRGAPAVASSSAPKKAPPPLRVVPSEMAEPETVAQQLVKPPEPKRPELEWVYEAK